MYSLEELKMIGKNCCVKKIGAEVVQECDGNGFFGYTEEDDGLYCNMGCSKKQNDITLSLTEKNNWQFYAECFVDKQGKCH